LLQRSAWWPGYVSCIASRSSDAGHGQVDVDGDPAAQAAEVPAKRKPRLVADDLEDDVLAVRQIGDAAGPRPCLLDHSRNRALDGAGGHTARLLPALVPLGERPVAWDQPFELLVGRREDCFVRVCRPDAVAALDRVRVRGGLARQHPRLRAQPDDLVAQPAVLELLEQRVGVADERARLRRRRRVDRRRELRSPKYASTIPSTCRPTCRPSRR
jgi:hypothetical protein